jgi:hypothetical protein
MPPAHAGAAAKTAARARAQQIFINPGLFIIRSSFHKTAF